MIDQIKRFYILNRELKNFLNEFKSRTALKKIIVVGSSRNLLDNKTKINIDSHDLVIRFNLAPTLKYEEFVGKKTDIIVCNHLFFSGRTQEKYNMDIKKQRNKIFVVIVDHTDNNHINYLKKNKNIFVDKSNDVLFFDNKLNSILRFHLISKFNIIKKFYYYKFAPKFTGGLIISSILKIIDARFKIIGFNLNKKNSNVDYYYTISDDKKKMGSSHDFEKENLILNELFSKHILFN